MTGCPDCISAIEQRNNLRVKLAESIEERLAALRVERELRAALKLAEPALRTLRDGHCNADCPCAYTKALDAVVATRLGTTAPRTGPTRQQRRRAALRATAKYLATGPAGGCAQATCDRPACVLLAQVRAALR